MATEVAKSVRTRPQGPLGTENEECNCPHCTKVKKSHQRERRMRRNKNIRRRSKFNFQRDMDTTNTKYDVITSVGYLSEKYGLRKSHYIENFIKCIHRKINSDVSKIPDEFVDSLSPAVKSKLFLLLVTLSERGGPDYWIDKNNSEIEDTDNDIASDPSSEKNIMDHTETPSDKDRNTPNKTSNAKEDKGSDKVHHDTEELGCTNTLMEKIIQQNINCDFKETTYDEDYVFSSIWANFMEGLINHYLEKVIVPHSEMKVCQQLYKPMMKIISLYNEYNELMEKSLKNGFLPAPSDSEVVEDKEKKVIADSERDDIVTKERLARAQKLLWQARQDIPKTISKELTLLSEMYSTLIADEQDYELDEFVCCAEEYVELEYLPELIDVLFINGNTRAFWKVLLALEPFFYYIEDIGDLEDESIELSDVSEEEIEGSNVMRRRAFKPDPRVITLEKICEVAARQKWI
ncbi:similar to Saccharomyces cerevisiae YKL075C Putative protein of unknown function [Maudiozyma barnettii]|uniref:Uncharacterized protein n=1 Tax=Maudiozyma barnettii TaxID=61262 RepID=A0A8H2VIV6_9SACH|nr:hypothetical protein [Kazachstania barnettii]CAB4256370.1 similar to Saccharomyces cerevisiae YKL075C Putative protein of unknown function [Kazachstania barnettii]CAD1784979.1 similar to Saccharomyces cerevisiae YKL075C Putative protein of unknown function [Kazachstania barnettii]